VITEGTRSNFYIELDGRLITSPVSAGLLPGTYRDLLIQEGCLVQSITLEMFKKSNRIFISNALIGKRLAVIGENSNGFAGIRNHLL
jgi:para-aminobenzoate synthetase/4-amino-4-deoxychorismate lyase